MTKDKQLKKRNNLYFFFKISFWLMIFFLINCIIFFNNFEFIGMFVYVSFKIFICTTFILSIICLTKLKNEEILPTFGLLISGLFLLFFAFL